jgi:Coenzyme PQQ synthesis protein D (PqqD)
MKEKASNSKPLARSEGLVIKELPDEVLVYDLDSDRAHCLNQTAAYVWQNCNGKNSAAEIARVVEAKLDSPVDEKIVWLALDQLGRNHLLDYQPARPRELMGMSRREMARALGLAAMVAVPVVTSIVAPTPAQAATCGGTGSACTTGAECCSGLCSTGPASCTPSQPAGSCC